MLELVWLLLKTLVLVVAMMGSGFLLGYLMAREHWQQEVWDRELLLNVLQRELANRQFSSRTELCTEEKGVAK